MYQPDRSQKRSARDSFSQLVVPQSMKYENLSNVHNHVARAHFGVHKKLKLASQAAMITIRMLLLRSTMHVRHHIHKKLSRGRRQLHWKT